MKEQGQERQGKKGQVSMSRGRKPPSSTSSRYWLWSSWTSLESVSTSASSIKASRRYGGASSWISIGAAATVGAILFSSSQHIALVVHAQDVSPTETPTGEGGRYADSCHLDTYYSNLSLSTDPQQLLENLRQLTVDNHRSVLPSSGGDGIADIYRSLIALDAASTSTATSPLVNLVFRNTAMPAYPFANMDTWSRADLWPITRGAARDSDALTDVHMKRPADSTVLLIWGDKLFGDCGVVNNPDLCQFVEETNNSTQTDGKIWSPPLNVKGDIARAIMYGQVRYGGTDSLALEVVDCPPFMAGQFGYKSMLLEWHVDDPPSSQEIARNDDACAIWQGNRNPFVDFPDFATVVFGQPDTIREGTYLYSSCTAETQAPTASPNECALLQAGDVQIILLNSEDPDQVVWFTLDQIRSGVVYLYVTSDSWDGTQFLENGGTMRIKVPNSTIGADNTTYDGMAPGHVFSYGFEVDEGEWEVMDESKPFVLDPEGNTGDVVFTYCLDADGLPNFLNGFSFSPGGWASVAEAQAGNLTSPEQSALPDALVNQGSVQLPFFKNWIYQGTTQARKDVLVSQYFNNPANYTGDNDVRNTIPALDGDPSSASAIAWRVSFGFAVVAGVLLTFF